MAETVQASGKRNPIRMTATGARRWTGRIEPYLYLLPALLFLAIFVLRPLVVTLDLSLHNWNMISPNKTFVGLDNYRRLLTDAQFWKAVANTGRYALLFGLMNFVLPLVMASLVFQLSKRWQQFFRIVIFSPTVISLAVVALIWMWVLNPALGIANVVMQAVGLEPVSWLNDPRSALTSVATVTAWKAFGYSFVLYLAGLVSIPKEFQEAASVDGASTWQVYRHVVLPLLRPTLTLVATNTIVVSAQYVFVPIDILTGGGPNQASTNMIYYFFERAFRFFQVGPGAAAAVLTVVFFLGLTILQTRLMERKEHVEA